MDAVQKVLFSASKVMRFAICPRNQIVTPLQSLSEQFYAMV